MGHFSASNHCDAHNFDLVLGVYILRRVVESEKADLYRYKTKKRGAASHSGEVKPEHGN